MFVKTASLNAIVSPIGGLMVSALLDRCGRKNTLYLINVFAMSAWILKATASRTNRDYMFAQLMLARVIVGITCGLASSPCSIYTAEISHASIRGRMSIMTPLGIASGVLVIYIVGIFIPVGNLYLGRALKMYSYLYIFNYRPIGDFCHTFASYYHWLVSWWSTFCPKHRAG